MAEKANNGSAKKEQYQRARTEFDSLKIEEKAVFMVEAAFSTLAHGIESFGNFFSDQVDKMYTDEGGEPAEEKNDAAKDEPAKAAPKKAAAKKTTSRTTRKTTRKTAPKTTQKSTARKSTSTRSRSKKDPTDSTDE